MKQTKLLKLLILSQIIMLSNLALGMVRNFETTRLKSTGGAGVGSLLMNESAILNPAPLGFFNNSSFYLQRNETTFEDNTGTNQQLNNQLSDLSDSTGIIVADTSKNLKGSIAYIRQQEGFEERKQINAALASAISKNSSMGFLYKKTEDENYNYATGERSFEDYQQLTIGITHAIDSDFTLGTILVDPFKANSGDSRVVVGTQYTVKKILSFMLDVGADYNSDLAATRQVRAAAQLNFYRDLFLRAGLFEDRALDERGTGIGLSWVGPKLVLEVSLKNSEDLGLIENDPTQRPRPDRISETAFSLAYYF